MIRSGIVSLRNAGNHPLNVGVFYVDSLGFAVPYPDLSGIQLAVDSPPILRPLTVSTWDPVADRPATTGVERLVITEALAEVLHRQDRSK